MTNFIRQQFQKVLRIVAEIESNQLLVQKLQNAADLCIHAIKNHRKILLIGNGGSAADAQHIAAEIMVRLRFDRRALPAIALTTDSSVMTAASNDNGYEQVFARQVAGLGNENDVLIAISTSGKSPNVLRAIEVAAEKKLKIIGLSGAISPLMDAHCDVVLNVPDLEVSKIQECHIMFGHIICELIENAFLAQETESLAYIEKNGMFA